MRLLRYGEPGCECPAALDADDHIRDLSAHIRDIDGSALARLSDLRALDLRTLPILAPGKRIGACVANVGKFICIGLNYADHAAESGLPLPDQPIVFMKATSAIAGPNDNLILPSGSQKVDWEVELGVVIGATARNLDERAAVGAIAGYCVVNDVSEREWQFEHGGQWVKGKSADGFGPIGPWMVTEDEIADPTALAIWLTVDGHRCQDGSTATMIFKPASLVSYLSRYMTLHPGDIIATGTPAGVGMGQKPPIYLRPGNRIKLGIAGLGEQEQLVVAADSDLLPQNVGAQ